MSAREKLLLWLRAAGVYGDLAKSEADQILGRHAHELAEKIRGVAETRVGWGQPMREAADLIDPEVSDG